MNKKTDCHFLGLMYSVGQLCQRPLLCHFERREKSMKPWGLDFSPVQLSGSK